MKIIISLYLLIFTFFNKDIVIFNTLKAYNMWFRQIFPLLFPIFVLSDFLVSTNIIDYLTKKFGKYYAKLFNTTPYALYILLISILTGTPNNAKNLMNLYQNNNISKEDINKILSYSISFNPLFIISITNIKILLISWISNFIYLIISKNKYKGFNNKYYKNNIIFNLSDSIQKNMNIIFNILGVIIIFNLLSVSLPFKNIYFKTFITGILEITNGLIMGKNIISSLYIDYYYLVIICFGSISILMQAKSILKDTLNLKYIIKSRIIIVIISLIICFVTKSFIT